MITTRSLLRGRSGQRSGPDLTVIIETRFCKPSHRSLEGLVAKKHGLLKTNYISLRRRDVAQPGRALRSGRRSRAFESRHPDHFFAQTKAPVRKSRTGAFFLSLILVPGPFPCFYPTILPIWNIGKYIATIIPPTTPPRKTMSMGSSMEVMAFTAVSTSSS